ncbi:hypothetical protein ACIRQH_19750 [Streptomyces sp. NPDC102279]|uniref:DUF7426 family protein n=1 Tax=Streptomyces sp. NPDC102279 TaxID=3366153 RepID=UPI00380B0BDF
MAAGSSEDFAALDAFLDEYLDLPVLGKDGETRVYRIEDPSAEDGMKIERITAMAARLAAGQKASPSVELLNDEEELDLYRMCLGAAYGPLLKEVRWGPFKHVALTVMFWVTTDKDTAREYWRTGNQPGKANRAARRAQAKPDTSESAAANSTRSPGSTSGTRGSRRRRGGQGRASRQT